MSWSTKYKKSINCNNPKGFSQKAHCAGKKKNESMEFEEISEEILDEKLIVYNNRKKYGQVVFIAGGAGSGKGFAISNFLDSATYKIRDVDEMKKQLQILNRLGKLSIDSIIKKYSKNIKPKDLDLINKIQDEGFKLQNLNLKNPNHVYALHILVKAIGIKDTSLEKMLLGKENPNVLPNILFDITAKDVTDITNVIPMLKKVGYKSNNIHLTWILTNYEVSLENNKNRSRKVPDGEMGEENIMLKTHEGASNTIWGLLTKALPKGMNGRADVILNNPSLTVFMKGSDGKEIEKTQKNVSVSTDVTKDGKRKSTRTEKDTKVKFPIGFEYLKIKKEGGSIISEKEWKKKLFGWIKNNAPESITANMKESTNESVTENRFANKPEVTPKQLLNIQADVRKINRKIKVYISKHPITKGQLNIELGHGHDNDAELDKIYKVLKKRTGDWRTGSMFNESINEQADYKYLTQVILDAKPKYDVHYNSSHNVVNIGGVGYDKGDLVKNFNQKPGSSTKIKNNFYHAHQDPQKTKREVEKLSKGKIKVKIEKNPSFVSYSLSESVNEAKSEKDFKLGTPAVFDGDRGEVITNPKTQRAWTPNGWGTVKKGVRGIMVYGSNSFIVPDWSKTKKFNESVNEGKVDRVVGHSRYKYVGDGRKGQAIVSGPMKDREKEAIIKRAKKAGYNAKPNMGGGVTIHVESLEVNEIGQFPINNYIQGIIPTGYLDTNTPQKKKQSVKLVSDLKKTLNTFWKQHDIPYRIK